MKIRAGVTFSHTNSSKTLHSLLPGAMFMTKLPILGALSLEDPSRGFLLVALAGGVVAFGCAKAFRRQLALRRQLLKQAAVYTGPASPGNLSAPFAGMNGIAPGYNHKPLVVVGPSGVGKGTLLELLFKDFPGKFSRSVSHTTRRPRKGEVHGQHYYFVERDEFLQHVNDGKFIEHAEFSGNMYGTSTMAVQAVAAQGKICILEIDTQGAKTVREQTPLAPHFAFIYPPSFDHLEKRLKARNTESEDSLKRRLDTARYELELREKYPHHWDMHIENDDLFESYHSL
eukprot:g39536.t1